MNDINHYGVLFQYDKKWQRLRTQKANQINALNSPKAFKNYFTKEVDAINTSLERISMVLETAKDKRQKSKILKSEDFKKDFSTLLRNINTLTDNIRLYNEDLFKNSNAR